MFLFKLVPADGPPAEPPTLRAAVPNWQPGDTIALGRRSLRVLRVRDDDADQPPVLVVEDAARRDVALAAGTACGGGGDSGSGAAKREIAADAQEQAKAINLRLSDFPDGWRASTPDEDTAGQRKFRKCIGADYSDVTLIGEASSKDFAQGESAQASSEAQITKNVAQATDGMNRLAEALAGSATKDCVRNAIGKTSGYKVGEIDVGELKFGGTPDPRRDESLGDRGPS
jgi:hypothetical protein